MLAWRRGTMVRHANRNGRWRERERTPSTDGNVVNVVEVDDPERCWQASGSGQRSRLHVLVVAQSSIMQPARIRPAVETKLTLAEPAPELKRLSVGMAVGLVVVPA